MDLLHTFDGVQVGPMNIIALPVFRTELDRTVLPGVYTIDVAPSVWSIQWILAAASQRCLFFWSFWVLGQGQYSASSIQPHIYHW